MSEDLTELLNAWDEVNAAIDRVLTSLPGQLSDNADKLSAARLRFRDMIQRYGFQHASDRPRT